MGLHHQGVRLTREGRRRLGVGRHQGARVGGLRHPRSQARGGRQVPQGRGGDLDHARRPRDARRRGRGAARGGVRHPLRVRPQGPRPECARRRGGRPRRRESPGCPQNGKIRIWSGHIRESHIRKTQIWRTRRY